MGAGFTWKHGRAACGQDASEPAGAPALNSGGFAAAAQVLATINSNSKKVVTYFNGALLRPSLPYTCIKGNLSTSLTAPCALLSWPCPVTCSPGREWSAPRPTLPPGGPRRVSCRAVHKAVHHPAAPK